MRFLQEKNEIKLEKLEEKIKKNKNNLFLVIDSIITFDLKKLAKYLKMNSVQIVMYVNREMCNENIMWEICDFDFLKDALVLTEESYLVEEKLSTFKNVIFQKDLEYLYDKKVLHLITSGQFYKLFKDKNLIFKLSGKVIKGQQLGRTINYPTANILCQTKLNISEGVYFSKVKLNGEKIYNGATCLRTFNQKLLLETFIFSFNEDIYDQIIEVDLYKFIRKNVKVKNLEHLKELLNKDVEYISERSDKPWELI